VNAVEAILERFGKRIEPARIQETLVMILTVVQITHHLVATVLLVLEWLHRNGIG
jgi:hypothetical protein